MYVSRKNSRNTPVAGVDQEPATGAHPQEKLLSQTYRRTRKNGLVVKHVGTVTRKINFLLTAWSRAFEKLTGSQLVTKFPAFYGTPRLIAAFTSALQLPVA
jgi:hypothetical protein